MLLVSTPPPPIRQIYHCVYNTHSNSLPIYLYLKRYLADLTETRPVFTAGYDCMLHIHTAESEVTVGKLLSMTDPKTKTEKKNPPFAKTGAQITCVLEVSINTPHVISLTLAIIIIIIIIIIYIYAIIYASVRYIVTPIYLHDAIRRVASAGQTDPTR
jgi:hypothetical protein